VYNSKKERISIHSSCQIHLVEEKKTGEINSDYTPHSRTRIRRARRVPVPVPSSGSSIHAIVNLERITVVVIAGVLWLSKRRDDDAPDIERDTDSGTEADAEAEDPPIIACVAITGVRTPNNPRELYNRASRRVSTRRAQMTE
jgi:hypothetical protein